MSFKISKAGDYKVRATKCELSDSGEGKEPQVYVRLETLDGNYHIDWYLGFKTEKAEKFSFKSLRLMGWRGADLSTLSALDVPNEVEIHVEEEVYNGTARLKAKWINDGGGGAAGGRPLDQSKAQTFAERMKAKLEKFDAENPQASAGDDIPF
jgi:hypothetical protein